MKLSLLTLIGSLLVMASATPAYAHFGAIAFSQSTGAWGTSYNWDTQAQAEQDAIGYCGRFDCRVVAWVDNGCAALAVGSRNAYGWAWSTERGLAEDHALTECESVTQSCSVHAWVCSG